ncbi:MAG: hypothetical protein RR547_08345, partial [Raoultibacter sp.]
MIEIPNVRLPLDAFIDEVSTGAQHSKTDASARCQDATLPLRLEQALRTAASHSFGVSADSISDVRIIKRSVDARKKSD